MNKSDLDLWLTERYVLFQDSKQDINQFEVHHPEWPIQELHIDELKINYSRFNTLIGGQPKKSHFSKGVEVVAWDREKV